jgi:hypothetical protein
MEHHFSNAAPRSEPSMLGHGMEKSCISRMPPGAREEKAEAKIGLMDAKQEARARPWM